MVRNRSPLLITTCLPRRTTLKPAFSSAFDRPEMLDAGNLCHNLDRHFNLAQRFRGRRFLNRREVFANVIANVKQCLLWHCALRPTAESVWIYVRLATVRAKSSPGSEWHAQRVRQPLWLEPVSFLKTISTSYSATGNFIAVAQDADSDLLNTVHSLPAEAQRAVLSYARFLREEEERSRLREDEAGWDQRFQDPERMARFASWAEKSLAGDDPKKPLDESTL